MFDWQTVIAALYFYIPAYAANMTPPIAARFNVLPFLNKPINQRYLGANKTWRGLLTGILIGFSVFALQKYFSSSLSDRSWSLGLLLPFGALVGDALFSLLKRQKGISPGKPWLPFDQIDHVLGAWATTFWIAELSIWDWIIILGFTFFLHLLVNWIGYRLTITKSRL